MTDDIDPAGPFFIAYPMHGDGPALAREVAWTLRTWGVPVWHAEADPVTGDIRRGLERVLDGVIAGGVLIVTPELAHAEATRQIEIPRLVKRQSDERFALLVGTTLTDGAGQPDTKATAALIPRWSGLQCENIVQFPIGTLAGRAQLARAAVRHRLGLLAGSGGDELSIDLRTRDHGNREDGPGLLVRCRPPLVDDPPPPEAWPAYADFLAELPALVRQSGARRVRVSGLAHLTPAFALGAALPRTRLPEGAFTVVDSEGRAWKGESDITLAESERSLRGTSAAVAAFVDLTAESSFATFERHVCERPDAFAARLTLALAQRRALEPADGATLARAAGLRLRQFVRDHGNPTLHLFLAVPFPVAVLLGRASNLLDVQLYERVRRTDQYVSSVRCRAGEDRPIVDFPTASAPLPGSSAP